jgi:hypothetical protein
MRNEMIWKARDHVALEHLRLKDDPHHASGCIVGMLEAAPFRILYDVRLDPDWRGQRLSTCFLMDRGDGMIATIPLCRN